MDEYEAKELFLEYLTDYFALNTNGVDENHLNKNRLLRINNFKTLINSCIDNGVGTLETRFFLNYQDGKHYRLSLKLEEI